MKPSFARSLLGPSLVVGLLACSGASPTFAPPPASPNAGPSPFPGAADPGGPTAPEGAGAATPQGAAERTSLGSSGPIAEALARVPESVAARYTFSLSDDRRELTIDPRRENARRATRDGSGGFSARDSENGGKVLALEGGPFRRAKWVRASFRDLLETPARLSELRAAGYAVEPLRDLLVVDGENDPRPTVFAFSAEAATPGLVGVCSDVTIVDFVPGVVSSRPFTVRKPVIYLRPERTTRVNVKLEVEGELLVHYPPVPRQALRGEQARGEQALAERGWTVTASPGGELIDDATGRRHRYLFWEATSAGFQLDLAQAHLVPGEEATPFLEHACGRFALTEAECGDFLTYWLPSLASNPYNVVQFVEEAAYGRYARLRVTPAPDTVIRPFMIFRRSDVPVAVGAPPLPQKTRRGFTVVEWGGSNLDEASPPVAPSR